MRGLETFYKNALCESALCEFALCEETLYLESQRSPVQQCETLYYFHFCIAECGPMQECISLQNCENTRNLKERADAEVLDFIKEAIYNQIKKLSCGNPIDETVCCEKQNLLGKKISKLNYQSLSKDLLIKVI